MRRLAWSLLPLGTVLLCFQGCYGATEILVTIQTDVPCATVRQSGIVVRATGAEAALPDATVLASGATCTDGASGRPNEVGTLVFVPTADTPQISIRVVLGVERPTETCDPRTSTGCITADRRITYERHRTLRLPIRLDDACIGRVCGDGQTCAAGACITSFASCTDSSCVPVAVDDAGNGPPPDVADASDASDGAVTSPPPDGGGEPPPVCPPRRPYACLCSNLKPVCCYETTGVQCYATTDECKVKGVPASEYACSSDCQCTRPGENCSPAANCPPLVKSVCGGSCGPLQ